MNERSSPGLRRFAQGLRKEMTKEERRLWFGFLKDLPWTVNRQKVLGPYIVDFYCAKAGLVIELDGSQHFEPRGRAADEARDARLRAWGLTVLRYANSEVNGNFDGVLEDIRRHLPD